MWLALLRKLFLTLITLIILSIISYNILLRDPFNQATHGSLAAYFNYLGNLLHGDLGISHVGGLPLTTQILNVFPATMLLCVVVMLFSLLIGLPLGFWAAVTQQTFWGKFLISLGSLSLAVPVFWLAIVWQAHFSDSNSDLLPLLSEFDHLSIVNIREMFNAMRNTNLETVYAVIQHLALPTLVLSIPATLEILRITQKRASYVLGQNYVKVARARGWSSLKVWTSLVLRNTLPALIPMIAHTFTLIFAFGMLIENIVSWSGIGRWLINALATQDYNAISAGVVAIGLFVLLVDLATSGLMTLLDPHQKKGWFNVK